MTFCPPCSTRAFDYGADVIIQSISKYLSGHNDVLGGALITKNEHIYEELKLLQKAIGAGLSPDECYRAIQGIKTLSLRWQRASESALKIAKFLGNHKKIKRILPWIKKPCRTRHCKKANEKRLWSSGFL